MRNPSMRLTICLLLMLLLAVPALAQGNDAPDSRLYGTWRVIYRIEDGLARREAAAETCVIADGQLTCTAGGKSYVLDLTAADGACTAQAPDGSPLRLTPAGENLLTVLWQRTTFILQRTALPEPPANPFLGDWQVLLYSIDGQPVTSGEGSTFFDLRFTAHSVSTLVDGVVFSARPCVYADGRCIIRTGDRQTICTLDESGMMTMQEQGADIVCFLLPVAGTP